MFLCLASLKMMFNQDNGRELSYGNAKKVQKIGNTHSTVDNVQLMQYFNEKTHGDVI